MKRSPLRRKALKPKRRRSILLDGSWRQNPKLKAERSKYKRRERDTPYMLWVKTLPCWLFATSWMWCTGEEHARDMGHRCEGVVEADHAAKKSAAFRKSADAGCIPLCVLSHKQRDQFSGPFKGWTRAQMRKWLDDGIRHTQAQAQQAGIAVPTC